MQWKCHEVFFSRLFFYLLRWRREVKNVTKFLTLLLKIENARKWLHECFLNCKNVWDNDDILRQGARWAYCRNTNLLRSPSGRPQCTTHVQTAVAGWKTVSDPQSNSETENNHVDNHIYTQIIISFPTLSEEIECKQCSENVILTGLKSTSLRRRNWNINSASN